MGACQKMRGGKMEELTEEERRELDYKSNHGICFCGHERNQHSKFINGLFIGCQVCDCKVFSWPIVKQSKEK